MPPGPGDETDIDVLVVAADDAYAVLADAVARRLGVAADDVRFGRAPCPACGGPHGRPVVVLPVGAPDDGRPHPHVSVASSGGVVAVAVGRSGPVGVDVEQAAAVGFAGFADVALHPGERVAAVRPGEALDPADPGARPALVARARLWARKEAALKAAGVGLLVAPSDVVVTGADEPARLVRWPRRPVRARHGGGVTLPPAGDVVLRDVPAPMGTIACLAHLPAAPPRA
ncbi:MAG: 4'-phosphopantetheinyl transferase superfamily protein [Actinobacteria bacterium]|nr:4'-phosphopantetheinyl transferase superfamily protein [Actinomycetota bacterium]